MGGRNKRGGGKKGNQKVGKQDNKKAHKKDVYSGGAEWRDFNSYAKAIGCKIRGIKTDGNCLFRALSDQLYGNDQQQKEIRQRVVKHLQDNLDEFSPFLLEDFEAYCNKMNRDGVWGGNLELVAFSHCYAVTVVVHQFNMPRFEIASPTNNAMRINITYHEGEHYSSIRRIDDDTEDAARPISFASDEAANNAKNKQEKIIMDTTGCANEEYVRTILEEYEGDVDAAVETLFAERAAGVEWPSSPSSLSSACYTSTSTSTSWSSSTASSSLSKKNRPNHNRGNANKPGKGGKGSKKASKLTKKELKKLKKKERLQENICPDVDEVIEDLGSVKI